MPIQLLIADDHPMVLQGLKALLEREGLRVLGEASDGLSAIRQATTLRPDVAILDLAMPHLNGIDAAREIMRVSPGTKTILLTMHAEEPYILQALRAGLHGYVLKGQAIADLIQAIRDLNRGGVYISTGVSRAVVGAYRSQADPPADPLTWRERQVLQMVAEGKSTKEISALLGISFKTVESHRSRIMSKLEIHEMAGLVRYAVRRGLIQA